MEEAEKKKAKKARKGMIWNLLSTKNKNKAFSTSFLSSGENFDQISTHAPRSALASSSDKQMQRELLNQLQSVQKSSKLKIADEVFSSAEISPFMTQKEDRGVGNEIVSKVCCFIILLFSTWNYELYQWIRGGCKPFFK